MLSLLLWGALHERAVEHAKDTAAAKQEVVKITKDNVAITADSTVEVHNDVLIFKQAVSLPPVGDIGVVCHAASRNPMPSATGNHGISTRPGDGQSVPDDVFDPSGDLLTKSRSGEARIRELRAEILSLRSAMVKAEHR